MLFQTTEFLILLLVVMAGIAVLRRAGSQHWMLLIASYVFYGWWDVRFLTLILLSTVIDYAAALGMQGVRLSVGTRAKLSGLLIGASLLFLGINWPAFQDPDVLLSETGLFFPKWPGARVALAACMAFAVIGPGLYGLYFRLGEKGRRRAFLITSVVSNLGMLGFFKYYNFFAGNLEGIGAWMGADLTLPALKVALPVGISFYTFQTMSYTIDAYRGSINAERSLVRMALYVSYFPQLVAGPILRPQELLPSLNEPWRLRAWNIHSGFHLALVGLFKKVLIADWCAPMVNQIFTDPMGQPTLVIWLGTALFAVQIYCDFSGYTDIARGVSRMFGVEIPLNFNFPYFSTSIIDFWRRWHISLSSWLRDYLYIPLGGSKCSTGRMYFNLMTTMVLGGLWHGAAWNFVIWGAYQGGLLCINRVLRAAIQKMPALDAALTSKPGTVFRWAATAYFWMLGWLIFRVSNFEHLVYCMKKFVLFDANFSLSALGLGRGDPFVALLAAGLFAVLHAVGFFGKRWSARLDALPGWALMVVYFLVGMVFFFGWPPANQAFIYFQF